MTIMTIITMMIIMAMKIFKMMAVMKMTIMTLKEIDDYGCFRRHMTIKPSTNKVNPAEVFHILINHRQN